MDGKKGKRAMSNGKVVKVSGPLVVATGLAEANMADVVRVGEQRLIGEVLTLSLIHIFPQETRTDSGDSGVLPQPVPGE